METILLEIGKCLYGVGEFLYLNPTVTGSLLTGLIVLWVVLEINDIKIKLAEHRKVKSRKH